METSMPRSGSMDCSNRLSFIGGSDARSKPGRSPAPLAVRPRSSSITSILLKPRRRATSTNSYWRWRTTAGRRGSCVVIADLPRCYAARLEQEPRHRSQHGLALRRYHGPKSHVVENEIELAWCRQGYVAASKLRPSCEW